MIDIEQYEFSYAQMLTLKFISPTNTYSDQN